MRHHCSHRPLTDIAGRPLHHTGDHERLLSFLAPQAVASQTMARAETTGDSRRTANWEARRQAIIDTSAQVFARRGYHATGISELCAANDLGKGALYHYIGSKEEILGAIHDRVMDEVMAGADRVAIG